MLTVVATVARDASPTITLSPVKNPRTAKSGSSKAAAIAATAPGLCTTELASPRIVQIILTLNAKIGNIPNVTRIAPTDCNSGSVLD